MSLSRVHFSPFTQIRRECTLQNPGNVIVRAGQKILPMDIVAVSTQEPQYKLLDVARILGITRNQADQQIQCLAGDRLMNGDLIAGPVGLSKRVIRAQQNCEVILTGDGQVLLELEGEPLQLRASIPGEVVELIPDRGAVIQTTGAIIQGIWGNGRLGFGTLICLGKEPDYSLKSSDLSPEHRGAIIFCGQCSDHEAWKAAAELPVQGMIFGSLAANLRRSANESDFPIILIEGFGDIPVNELVFRLLGIHQRQCVVLNASIRRPFAGQRPEIIISKSNSPSETAHEQIDELHSERLVRILGSPFAGQIGSFVRSVGTKVFENGIRAPSAEIRLADGRNVCLPLSNLEVIA